MRGHCGTDRHIFSMRKANEREQARLDSIRSLKSDLARVDAHTLEAEELEELPELTKEMLARDSEQGR